MLFIRKGREGLPGEDQIVSATGIENLEHRRKHFKEFLSTTTSQDEIICLYKFYFILFTLYYDEESMSI